MLVELQQLFGDFGGVESQAQAVDVELWDDVLQRVLQGQAPPRPVLGGCGRGVLKNGTPKRDELLNREKGWSGVSWGFERALPSQTRVVGPGDGFCNLRHHEGKGQPGIQ